jgi:hypothetical protein
MCGIAGWLDFHRDMSDAGPVVAGMTRTVALRGPDDEGLWTGPRLALGHRRLAVIDPPNGHQPMVAPDGAAVLSFGGEIYNFRELRAELSAAGHRFRTGTDTEVLLAAYRQWGRDMLARLNGMFAFALWDTRAERLLLARDQLGVKPLFYSPTPDGVIFGSEPKAVLAHPDVVTVVDQDGLRELFSHARTPGRPIYRGVPEVRPGHVVVVDRSGLTEHRYWSITASPHTDDLETTVGTVRELLADAVGRQLVADVPTSVLLSGGIDSSMLTALAAQAEQKAGAGPVRTYSMSFPGYTEEFGPQRWSGGGARVTAGSRSAGRVPAGQQHRVRPEPEGEAERHDQYPGRVGAGGDRGHAAAERDHDTGQAGQRRSPTAGGADQHRGRDEQAGSDQLVQTERDDADDPERRPGARVADRGEHRTERLLGGQHQQDVPAALHQAAVVPVDEGVPPRTGHHRYRLGTRPPSPGVPPPGGPPRLVVAGGSGKIGVGPAGPVATSGQEGERTCRPHCAGRSSGAAPPR